MATEKFEDSILVHKYLCGDNESGQKLYLGNMRYLEKYIAKKLNQRIQDNRVQEVFQETLSRSVQGLSNYKKGAKFSTWLCGIAKNVMFEKFRDEAKRNELIPLEELYKGESEHSLSEFYNDPIDILVYKEKKECIEKSISELKVEYQSIITLRLYNKASVKQISTLSGDSESAIDSRFRRAIKALGENIKKNRC